MTIFWGILRTYIGQSMNFVSEKRIVLIFLMNIFTLNTVMLGIVYQSTVTSFMMEPPTDNCLKTINELEMSAHKIVATRLFEEYLSTSQAYPGIKSRIVNGLSNEEAIERGYAFIIPCGNTEYKYHKEIYSSVYGDDSVNSYYMLPEVFHTYFQFYDAGIVNPYLEKLQYFMDFCFAGGLTQHWDFLHSLDLVHRHNIGKHQNEEEKEGNEMLTMKELKPGCIALIFGCILSFFVFLLEIFYHDCLSKLTWEIVLRRKTRRVSENQPLRLNKKKLRVKFIQVKPINPE